MIKMRKEGVTRRQLCQYSKACWIQTCWNSPSIDSPPRGVEEEKHGRAKKIGIFVGLFCATEPIRSITEPNWSFARGRSVWRRRQFLLFEHQTKEWRGSVQPFEMHLLIWILYHSFLHDLKGSILKLNNSFTFYCVWISFLWHHIYAAQ